MKFISSPQAIVLLFTVVAAFWVARSSFNDSEIRKRIDKGVKKIDTVVAVSEKKLNEASKKLIENNTLISKNLEKTIKANDQLEASYEKIVDGLNKTIETKEATIEAQKEILGQITGGDSYPKIELKKDGFYLGVVGAYSIPSLKVQIGVIHDCLNVPKKVMMNYLKNGDTKIYNEMISTKYSRLWKVPYTQVIDTKNLGIHFSPDERVKIHGFDIYFESAYKKWNQKIRIVSHNGNWEIADVLDELPTTQKTNVINSKEIYKKVSKDFPSFLPGTGKHTAIPFYNRTLFEDKPYIEFIEHNQKNGISNHSLDYFSNSKK